MEARERKVREGFRKVFEYDAPGEVRVVSAPGRVNLIGEHLDYNGGSVMPVAIDRYITVLAVPNGDARIRVYSDQFKEFVEWGGVQADFKTLPQWARYIYGVSAKLKVRFGFDMFILSDVPLGAGLSSSAALEVACAYGLLLASAEGLPFLQNPHRHFDIARLCKEAEHEFAGVTCGLMDQVASVFSRKGEVMVFDTHFNQRSFIEFFKNCTIAVVDSKVRRNLADSRYNARRQECAKALEAARAYFGDSKVRRWADLSSELLPEVSGSIDSTLFKRAYHVVSEMERVEEAACAMRVGDKKFFGFLMGQSHESLRFNFEVSIPELDALRFIAENVDGVYGARLTGAGFGGCVITLLEKGAEKEFEAYVAKEYERNTNIKPDIFFTDPASGALELFKL